MDELEELKARVCSLEKTLGQAIDALNAATKRLLELEPVVVAVDDRANLDRAVVSALVMTAPDLERLKRVADNLTSVTYADDVTRRAGIADHFSEQTEMLSTSGREHMQYWGDLFNEAANLRKG